MPSPSRPPSPPSPRSPTTSGATNCCSPTRAATSSRSWPRSETPRLGPGLPTSSRITLSLKFSASPPPAILPCARLTMPHLYGPDLREIAQLQLDAAILFEQVANALKLIGEHYLTRVYGLVSRRFHLADWDASITRKLQAIDRTYSRLADRAAARRMEMLEWIIIILIAIEIAVSVGPSLVAR